MIGHLAAFLHSLPLLCLFLSILLGTFIGRFHVKGVGFGSVVGTLIAGMAIGILAKPELPDLLRWAFFYLFLFSIGYSVGPQFFGSLKKEALPQIALALIVAVSGLATVIGVSVAFGFDEGLAVGVLSGGMTQSAALGTGLSAIAELPISDAEKATLLAHAPLGDAITYGFGDLGLILFLTWLGPKILRADLKREAKALEATLSGGKPAGQIASRAHLGLRAYTRRASCRRGLNRRRTRTAVRRRAPLGAARPAWRRTAEAGSRADAESRRQARRVRRSRGLRRRGARHRTRSRRPGPALGAHTDGVRRGDAGGDDRRAARRPGAGRQDARAYTSSRLQRGTEAMPREAWTRLERGDLLHVIGAPDDVERAAEHIGYLERDLSKTDLTFLAGAICAGMLIGLLKLSAGGITLGLGTAGSILVVGLVGGWVRSRYPVFGAIPEPAQQLLMDIGLTVFIAVVGLHAGPHAVEAYRASGGAFFASIFVGGIIVTSVPLAVGTLAARYLLKMSPLMVLGGLAGAQTCTPGLTALNEASGSNVGALAYTVPYAIGNIVLTIWGPVVVAIVHAMRGPS